MLLRMFVLCIVISFTLALYSCQKEVLASTSSVDSDSSSAETSDTIAKGEILLSYGMTNGGMLTILDQDGNVIKQKATDYRVENFQKWNLNGTVRYTYFFSDSSAGNGYEAICDSDLTELKIVKLLSYGKINTAVQDDIDEHEFILLSDDHYLLDTYYPVTPNNIPDSLNPAQGVQVTGCFIQEINNGEVVWQWDGTEHSEFYGASVENNDFTDAATVHDYMHLNSMFIDTSDNNLIVSFRNLNQIAKINRTTGDIMWRLGGTTSDFSLSDDQQFLRQHYVRLINDNKTLLFLDNGDATLRPYSRALQIGFDEQSKTITNFSSFTIPFSFIQYAGNVQKEGNTYLIGGGSAAYTAQVNYVTGEQLMLFKPGYTSYRSIKYAD